MRIISGKLKGRRINPPSNLKVRPTTDMAKEGLFDILNGEIDYEESNVLDMFGGTGGITLEFVSRGVDSVTTIEMNSSNYNFIKKTINELGISEYVNTIKGDAFKFIENTNAKFDVIFADPPYAHPKLGEIPQIVFQLGLLKEDGLFILEHPKDFEFATDPHFYRHRNYGHVNFSFFRYRETKTNDE